MSADPDSKLTLQSFMTDVQRLSAALADRYTVERELGRGGMATVYLARDLKHDRNVAIKVLHPEIGAALGASRFLLEIKTTASLRHPHIVPLFDSGEVQLVPQTTGERSETLLYYVMPLVDGESLRARIDRDRQLPIDEALRVAGEVADALSYAHARGVVHRDIKPENIMIEGGHAAVADFGIARALSAAGGERITQTGMSLGTPMYMSPEQAAGERDIDGRSDLYSLACVLYEMLGGQPPFTGTSAATITRQHMIANPPPITNLRPSVPAAVVDALQRALSKSPADRFNPVAQFGSAIAPAAITAANAPVSNAWTQTIAKAGAARRNMAIVVVVAGIVVIAAFALWKRATPTAASGPTETASIAVLPFADLSPDHANAYLGDGIAETLINALVNVSGLTVTARNSAFSFRGREADVKEIGKQLHVGVVLSGSVQRAGDKLRISAQLVNAVTGVNLWANSFDRQASDIFAVQDEVARSAVTALKLRLAPGSTNGAAPVGTRNADAYNAYLLGRFHWNLRTSEGMVQATAALKRAVALDSTYALAWAGLGDAYMLSVSTEYPSPGLSDDSLNALSELAVRRAIALDPKLGEAYISLANVLDGRTDAAEVETNFATGIRLSPNYATGHQWYSYYLGAKNRWAEAITEMEAAHRLDPLSHVITLSLAASYDAIDRFADATPLYAQGFAQSPEAWYAWGLNINHELALGHVDRAVLAYKRWLVGMGDDSTGVVNLQRELENPATRGGAIQEMVRRKDMHTAVAFARWLSGDDSAIALLERTPYYGRGPTPSLLMAAILGPRLRASPRMIALIPKLSRRE
jgi:eukaryotic-like serine/threonine-protein kinase